jgi:hypothetical protein
MKGLKRLLKAKVTNRTNNASDTHFRLDWTELAAASLLIQHFTTALHDWQNQ